MKSDHTQENDTQKTQANHNEGNYELGSTQPVSDVKHETEKVNEVDKKVSKCEPNAQEEHQQSQNIQLTNAGDYRTVTPEEHNLRFQNFRDSKYQ